MYQTGKSTYTWPASVRLSAIARRSMLSLEQYFPLLFIANTDTQTQQKLKEVS
jgi:hypothetical protein